MKIIIAGPRDYTVYEDLLKAISECPQWINRIEEVVSGKASGVDAMGERWAKESGIPIKEFPADWKKHGKRAGPIRNQRMAVYADALIAIWDGQSRGTMDMINKANQYGLSVYVHRISR